MRILFISHELTLSGAPMVLLDIIRMCLKEQWEVDIRYFKDGDLRHTFEQLGISLIHQDGFKGDKGEEFLLAANTYDLIWANTIVCSYAMHILNLLEKPVIWWIHERDMFFDAYERIMPKLSTLRPGIRILAVSPRIRALGMRRYNALWDVFPFMIEDKLVTFRKDMLPEEISQQETEQRKSVRFLVCGTIGAVKGIDLLCVAYHLLAPEIREIVWIELYGNPDSCEEAVMKMVQQSEDDHFRFMGMMSHDQMLEEMKRADYILAPSREDSMPTVVAESWMCGTPVVLSDGCGISDYMKEGQEGLIVPMGDCEQLANGIEEAVRLRIKDPYRWVKMGHAGRALYEKLFSPAVVREKLLDYVYRLTDRNLPGLVFCTEGENCHDSFSRALMREFFSMGYEVLELCAADLQSGFAKLSSFLPRPVKAVFAFNFLLQDLEVVQGENLWEGIETHYVTIMTERLSKHLEECRHMPVGSVLLCTTSEQMDEIPRVCPNVGTYGFLPYAASNFECGVRPICERTTDVLYVGNGEEDGLLLSVMQKLSEEGARVKIINECPDESDIQGAMRDARLILTKSLDECIGAYHWVLDGMLSGAVVMTESCSYLREAFSDGELQMFDVSEAEHLPERLWTLLKDPDNLQRIADAGRYRVLINHTWAARAHELEDELLRSF